MSSQSPIVTPTSYGEGSYGTSSYGGVTRPESDEGSLGVAGYGEGVYGEGGYGGVTRLGSDEDGDGEENWEEYYSPLREMYGGLTEIQNATDQGP